MKTLILALSALISLSAYADTQQKYVDETKQYISFQGPMLLEGKDELGHCQVFIYPDGMIENGAPKANLWLEGTFQTKEGAALGIIVPFLVSSDEQKGKILTFEQTDTTLAIEASYPLEPSGTQQLGMTLFKNSNNEIDQISYRLPHTVRTCSNLKRTLFE